MRVSYKELMDNLAVGYILSAYETKPWFVYDAERGISCSAEVRIGPGVEDVEAEIQFLHDEKDGRYTDERDYGGPQQIMLMRCFPTKDQIWSPVLLIVKGESYVNKIFDWEGKGCNFFCACIQAIQMGEIPDIDALIEQELEEDSRWGGRGKKGKIGKKAPSINAANLLGMKR
jgi:hypothetical protein